MEWPHVVAGNSALSFSLKFSSIFVDISCCNGPITLIWLSLERCFPPAEVKHRWCPRWWRQKWKKGQGLSWPITVSTGVNGLSRESKITTNNYAMTLTNLLATMTIGILELCWRSWIILLLRSLSSCQLDVEFMANSTRNASPVATDESRNELYSSCPAVSIISTSYSLPLYSI